MTERHDIRKEVRMSAEETIELMRQSSVLGVSESDVLRMAFRLMVKKFNESGILKSTGNLPE